MVEKIARFCFSKLKSTVKRTKQRRITLQDLSVLWCTSLTMRRLEHHLLYKLHFCSGHLFSTLVADMASYLDLLTRAISAAVYTGLSIQLTRWTADPSQRAVLSLHNWFLRKDRNIHGHIKRNKDFPVSCR